MSQLNLPSSSPDSSEKIKALIIGKQPSIEKILSAPSFHFRIDDVDRLKFETEEHSGDGNVTLYITPVNPVIDDTNEYSVTIGYQFEKRNFKKGSPYGPNDTYDVFVSARLGEFQSTANFEAQIKSFLESLIRSGHLDTNGD